MRIQLTVDLQDEAIPATTQIAVRDFEEAEREAKRIAREGIRRGDAFFPPPLVGKITFSRI